MNFKVICPKDKDHKAFSVTAHIAQEWMVGTNGDYIKVLQDQTDMIHSPDATDFYICYTCGAEAKSELIH